MVKAKGKSLTIFTDSTFGEEFSQPPLFRVLKSLRQIMPTGPRATPRYRTVPFSPIAAFAFLSITSTNFHLPQPGIC